MSTQDTPKDGAPSFAVVATAVMFLCLHYPAVDALSPQALLLIANSLSLNASNGNISCASLPKASICNASYGCTWNSSFVNTSLSNGSCIEPSVVPDKNGTTPLPIPQSWCYKYFPEWFLAIIFLLCCVSTGVAIGGLAYNFMYYDVYVTTIDGERLYNKYYYNTMPFNVYLAILVAASAMLFASALTYFENPTNCAYVPMAYIFLCVAIGVPIVAAAAYFAWEYYEWYTYKELQVDLEEYIMPKTKEALPKYNNQVRCF